MINNFHNITKCQAVPYLNHSMKLGQNERFNSVRQCCGSVEFTPSNVHNTFHEKTKPS